MVPVASLVLVRLPAPVVVDVPRGLMVTVHSFVAFVTSAGRRLHDVSIAAHDLSPFAEVPPWGMSASTVYPQGVPTRPLGALLVTAATGTAIYAMIDAGETGWLAPGTLTLFAAALLGYLLFGWRQRTAASPLMDLTLLRRRPVAAGVFVIGIATALMVAVFFLGSFYLQEYADRGPLVTGLLFLPVALFTMAGANLGGRIIGRTGGRGLGVVGLAVAAVGLAAAAVWPSTTGVVTGISLAAAGIGGLFVVAAATALGNVDPHEAGIASGVLSTFHEFGASLGAAVVSSVAAAGLTAQSVVGYSDAFATAAVAAVLAALIAGAAIPGTRR